MSINRGIQAQKQELRQKRWECVEAFLKTHKIGIHEIYEHLITSGFEMSMVDLKNLMSLKRSEGKCKCNEDSGYLWELGEFEPTKERPRADFSIKQDLPNDVLRLFGFPG
jgi:hypothetical protein